MASPDDDYYASLGGSLIKDLLADLQVDDNEFSLEQLEKELSSLDQQQQQQQPHRTLYGATFSEQPSAAALVVSHAQTVAPYQAPGFGGGGGENTLDAWSLSLKNFTSMSLEQEFLAADSVRRQQHQPILAPPGLQEAEDYDVDEKPAVLPPPGMGGKGMPPGLSIGAPPTKEPEPVVATAPAESPAAAVPTASAPPPPDSGPSAPPSHLPDQASAPVPSQPQPYPARRAEGGPPPGVGQQMAMPPPPQGVPVQMSQIPVGHAPPPHMMQQMPPHMAQQPQQSYPVAMPVPQRGQAWQQPVPPPPSQQQKMVFCNPHPAAPPVSASLMKGKLMSTRDVAYVIHSILRPVLAAGISEDDYYIQVLQRLNGGPLRPNSPRKPANLSSEMNSRAAGAKQWSNQNSILGHVVKTNVSRPRALIAVPVVADEGNDDTNKDQKQRAALWKSRIYCDQAYQAHRALSEAWKFSPTGTVSPQVQLGTKKLLKCIGISMIGEEYRVDIDAFQLLVKLRKGRVLLSRILDQASIPPNAAQALLPASLDTFFTGSPAKDEDDSFDRVLRSITRVLHQLNLSGFTLVSCLDTICSKGKRSLSTTARMECAHALLQKGAMVVPTWTSDEDKAQWLEAERKFNDMLQD